jgi:uncharacterized membrane protein YphA (DoxX/SURF4 family)
LAVLKNDRNLINHVKTHDVERTLKPDTTLRNASRAVTIIGRMLDEIGRRHGKQSIVLRWLTRSGLMIQGLVAVSLPGSLKARWWAHIMSILYLSEITMLVSALLLGSGTISRFAGTLLAITLIPHLIILLVGDFMQSQAGWFKKWKICGALILLALAGVGGLALYNLHWRAWLYGENPNGGTCIPSQLCGISKGKTGTTTIAFAVRTVKESLRRESLQRFSIFKSVHRGSVRAPPTYGKLGKW